MNHFGFLISEKSYFVQKIVLGAKKVKFYKMLVDRKRKNKEVFKHEKT